MKFLTIFLGYLKWHYTKALATIFIFWKNILIFLFNFFSIKILLASFFSPWKRMSDSYPKHFDLQAYIFTFIANTIMRIVGMILRSLIIIVGLACCIAFMLLLPFIFIAWFVSPAIIIALIIYGLVLIIFS